MKINFADSKIISTFAIRFAENAKASKKFIEKTDKISTSKYRENKKIESVNSFELRVSGIKLEK